MHRGCVNNFPISTKIARERSAWSPIDSKSDGLLRARDFDSVCANAARGTVAVPQPNDTIRTIERTNIAASAQTGKLSSKRANCSALRSIANQGKFCWRAGDRRTVRVSGRGVLYDLVNRHRLRQRRAMPIAHGLNFFESGKLREPRGPSPKSNSCRAAS
jgi:hypothetical protein